MEKWKKRSIDLLTSLAFGSRDGSPSVVPYYPQKTAISSYEERYFSRTVPEKHGISSKRIYNMLCELEAERRANIHSLLVLAGSEVIAECSRDGYDVNMWHLSHSMSKTVTGMAVGMLVDDGKLSLDMRLADIFPDYAYRDKKFANITVHHLLSMTAGVSFSEVGSVTERDWATSFFASSVKFVPGSKFNYNSMNSYMLAKIVVKVSGKSLSEFLDERLFSPLGIRNYFWEKGPDGIEKGGWGLYMSAESWAKLGQMLLSRGVFEGRRLLSEDWIRLCTETQAIAPNADGDFNYGYQLWVGRNGEEILFNGMLGQNVWICPKNNIVAVVFSGNNEIFQNSPAMEIIRKYLGCEIGDALHKRDIKVLHERETRFFDSRRWVRPKEKKRGLLTWLGVRPKRPFDDRFSNLLGSYAFGKNGEGILPLFVRGMQNNLDSEIEQISFDRYEDSLFMIFRERGADYRIEVGLYDYKETVLDFRGEKYIVKVMGEALINANGDEEYRFELLFPELPNTRMLTVTREDYGKMLFLLSEVPNNKIIDALIENASETSGALGFVIDLLERRFGEGFIEKKLESTFTPALVGADMSIEGYNNVVAEETAKAAEQSRTVKLLRAVVDRFFKEDDEPEEEQVEAKKPEQTKPQKFFLADIIEKLRAGKSGRSSE